MEITMSVTHYSFFYFILSNLLVFFILPLNYADNGCLEQGESISTISGGANRNTIISLSQKFELGFFTPDGSLDNKGKYLGIWYYNNSHPRIVVWVANRENAVLEFNASLVIKGGDAKVLGINGTTYWSTGSGGSDKKTYAQRSIRGKQAPPYNMTLPVKTYNFNHTQPFLKRGLSLCLADNGNLILYGTRQENSSWHRFLNPITDTFLPGMSSYGNLNLSSWRSSDNPAQGDYTLLQQLENEDNKLVIEQNGIKEYYYQSGMTSFDDPVPEELFHLLNYSDLDSYSGTIRLVIHFTGQIQFWKSESQGSWSLLWADPKDLCSLNDACGAFASCNSNNGLLCHCLPGFKLVSDRLSDGCVANSGNVSPGASDNYKNDTFLRLPMMKVGKASYIESADDGQHCQSLCLSESTCVAYSCGVDECGPQKKCMTWKELGYLEEGYSKGITLFTRTTNSDLKRTSKSCDPCGAYIIPYPLSTGKNCGDASYFNFRCNQSTGQVSFTVSGATFNVTSIDPDRKRFFIQAGHTKNCDRNFKDSLVKSQNNNLSLHFNVKNCTVIKIQSFTDIDQSFIQVEMSWNPPLEPACNRTSDCRDWLHTTCKGAGDQKRCRCSSKYKWNGLHLQCTKEPFPRKVVIASISSAMVFILLCGIIHIYHIRKRRIARKQGFNEFKGDDSEVIDVPFFEWESILAATNNFSDENNLGKGGFGSVHKGTLPDGKEVAVKRLSNVSVQGVEEFRTEVVLIAKLQHRNLVRLLGYCVKSDEKILIYELMPNGSLDSLLFDETHSVFLDWEKRFDIIFGIARGLLYLHQDSRLRVIHRDLKPSNILLDEELNAKISDFGLAKIIGGKDTEGSTKTVVGTYGYMSPEYAYGGVFSVKSDVFSFGVVVLETICGRRNSKIFGIEFGTTLPGHAWRLWNEDRGMDLMNQTLKESCNPFEVLKCIHVGLLCVQEEPSDRPTMSAVFLMLSSDNASLPTPKQPGFSITKHFSGTGSSSGVKDQSVSQPSFISDHSFSEMITVSTVGR